MANDKAKHEATEMSAALPELHPDHVRALAEGRHPRPHDALGQHPATVGAAACHPTAPP
jgi:hypothetical protein